MVDLVYQAVHPSVDRSSLKDLQICHLLFVPASPDHFHFCAGDGAGDTLPKANRLIIDSRSTADSVSVIVLPGARFCDNEPGESAMNLSPIKPLVLTDAIVSSGSWTSLFTSKRTTAAYWGSRLILSTRPTGTPAKKT